MSYRDLFRHVQGLAEKPVSLDRRIVPKVKELTGIHDIEFTPVPLDLNISYGHIKQFRRVPPPYSADDGQWAASIRFHEGLSFCWQRFVCCKELMHLFDDHAQQANSGAKLKQLLEELETPAPWPTATEMYKTEINTQWMAVAVLCPPYLRNFYKPAYKNTMTNYEIALEMRVPEDIIQSVMGDFYDTFVAPLMQ